jgi:hypothetical protein
MNCLPKTAPSQVPQSRKPLRGAGCREKGKRGERQWRDELRANGYAARRGQQFSGSAESPDVVCGALDWVHFEVKAVERLNIEDAMEQARRDCDGKSRKQGAESGNPKVPIVAHRRRFRGWLVTMEAETFFRLLRGDYTEGREGREEGGEEAETKGNGQAAGGGSQISDFNGLSGPGNSNKTQQTSAL